MATYRVGASGATVFDRDGKVITRLPPGHVVVDGTPEGPGSPAYQYQREHGYSDKMIRPAEDKSL